MILSNSRTLLEDLEQSKTAGFTEEFMFINGKLMGRSSKKVFSAEDLVLCEYLIHESLSDPSDQSILFLISTNTGLKGVLSSAYGIYADYELVLFCLSLEKLEK
jgi:hypothetical protein